MKLIIIRHGEPDNPNNTLTKKGFDEVRALSSYLKDFDFDEAYVSPLARAQLTAEAVLKPLNKKAITLPWLQEFTHLVEVPYNQNRVINWDFMPSYFTQQDDFYDNEKYLAHPCMESADIKKYYQEVTEGLDKILAKHGYIRNNRYYQVENSNRDVVVLFCHFGMMSVIMSHLMNIPYIVLAQSFCCQCSGITTLVTEEREKGVAQFRCLQYGSITHLENDNQKPSFHGRFCEIFDSDERH